jgi:hypothetical protein
MMRAYFLPCVLLVAVACTAHDNTSDEAPELSAERGAAAYLAFHNERDQEAGRVVWGPEVDKFEPMMAWFRDQVGSCSGFSPMDVTDELRTRFVFECERGQLELYVGVDAAKGEIERLLIGARGVEPPAEVREAAEQLVALANGDPATDFPLADSLDQAEMHKQLDVISALGRCAIDRVHLGSLRGARFVLECANGSTTVLVDLDRLGALRRFGFSEGAADTWRTESTLAARG